MTTKELIRQEIVRRIEWLNTATNDFAEGRRAELRSLYDFLDTLPDEPEQPTKGYDEAYLNEKIAKASKSWEGVDVDKFMDEIRGREPVTDCGELEEEAEEWAENEAYGKSDAEFEMAYKGFIAGAELQKRKMIEWSDEKEIKNVTRNEREELHRLLDKLLDEGVGVGTFQIAYAWPSKNLLYRTYRIQIKQYDVEK